jgi:molybdopterin/thiamine biosynthesis adenylyltransferase
MTLIATTGTIFDCTDNQDTQRMLKGAADQNKRPYIRTGYNGTHITVTNRVPTWNVLEKPRTVYEIFPSWVTPAVVAAALGVAKAMYAPDLDVSLDLKEIGKK